MHKLTQLLEVLQEQLARLNPKDRRALVIVTVFLTVVIGYVQLIEPVVLRSDQASAALAELEDQQRRYARQALMLPKREAKFAEYRAEFAALSQHFELDAIDPDTSVSRSIVELSYYARLAKAEVSAIRPLDARTVAEYLEIPMEVEVAASLEALRKFFYYIETSPALLAITDIQLAAQEGEQLQARLKLSNIVLAKDPDEAPVVNLMPRENRLQLAISRWTGYAPLVIAEHNGYLESESMRVNLLLVDDKVTVERLLVSGDADGIGVSLPGLLNYWVEGIPLKIVFPLDSTAGTEGIAVLPESSIKTLADLRQQTVAVEAHGILEFVLARALKTAGLGLADIQTQALNTSQVARELASGTLEAGVSREPFLSSLVEREQARLIYSSEELEGLIVDFLAVTPKAIEKKSAVLMFLVEGLLKARKFIAEQPDRAVAIVADWENQPAKVTRANLAKIKLFDKHQINDFFRKKRLAKHLATFEKHLESIGQPLPLVTFEDLVAPTFFQGAIKKAKSASGDGRAS